MLAILLVSLLAVSAVSAADNVTDDLVGMDNQDDNAIIESNNSNSDGDILNVNSKTFADLNNVINGNTKSDIYLNGDYTYNPSYDSNFINGININRAVTIHGNGYTIDGADTARIFNVSNNNVVFRDIVFANGHSADYGGAIYSSEYSSISVVNCDFINNFAKRGGAMTGGYAVNCNFIDNSVYDFGGAMYKGSALNCTFRGNHANKYGGAMYGGSAENCIFIGNSANFGGAVADCSALNCTFQDNSVRGITSYGGAMYGGSAVNCNFIGNSAEYSGGAMNKGSALNCTFRSNHAEDGGAMSDGSAVNCTFFDNFAEDGGAMFGSSSSALNCTFTGNHADVGGAMYRGSAVNSNFINNSATWDCGGAMYAGSADSCIFIGNSAKTQGGAMYEGSADSCIFNGNTAVKAGDDTYKTTVLKPSLSVSDFTSSYKSGEKLIIDFTTSKGVPITNANVRINVYKNNEFVGTYNCLSGDGWVVDLDPGSYVAVVSVPGSDVDSADATVTVNKVKTRIASQKTTVTYNDGGKLVATLTNAVTGKAIANTNIVFKINDVRHTVKTDSKGQAKLSTNGLNPDEYTATISYAGNSKYASSTKSVNVVVTKADTSISATIDDNELVATLTHGVTGKAISGAKIVANINGKSYDSKTDSKGQVSFYIDSDTVPATVSYAGNAKYNPSGASVNTKANMVISAVYDEENREIVATLTNEVTGKAVTSATVQVVMNGAVTAVKTNTKGQAKISTAGLPLGTNTAKITYAGNSKYNPASTTISFDVKTKVIITDIYGDSSELRAKLTNGATGSPIANANMDIMVFYYSDDYDHWLSCTKKTAKSDSKGQISLPQVLLGEEYSNEVIISYAGNSRYTPSSVTTTLDINKANMMITYSYNANKQKLTATLKNSITGKVVSNANMVVDVNGVQTTLKSNSNGQITFSTAGFAPGTYVGTITYGGNAKYNPISAAFKAVV